MRSADNKFRIQSYPGKEVEELPPLTSCHIASALRGRTETLLTIAFSKDEEGGHRHIICL